MAIEGKDKVTGVHRQEAEIRANGKSRAEFSSKRVKKKSGCGYRDTAFGFRRALLLGWSSMAWCCSGRIKLRETCRTRLSRNLCGGDNVGEPTWWSRQCMTARMPVWPREVVEEERITPPALSWWRSVKPNCLQALGPCGPYHSPVRSIKLQYPIYLA